MLKHFLLLAVLALGSMSFGGDESPPPREPIHLFNGKDLTGWEFYGRPGRKKWKVGAAAINPAKKQTLTANPGGSDLVNTDIVGSDLVTTAAFRDFKLEFEF